MTDDDPATSQEPLFRPVRRKRTSDEAVEQILDLVRNGRLSPGQQLPPERELVKQLGVSRSSLREAIFVLQTMGVLHVVRGHGTWVREDGAPTLSDDWYEWMLTHRKAIAEMLELYEVLEARLTAMAAEKASPEQVAELEQNLRAIEKAALSKDYEGLVAADAAFHDTIRDASGNTIMSRVLRDLDENVLDVRRGVMALPQKPLHIVEEHARILHAIADHDSEAAARLTFELTRRAKEDVLAAGLPALRHLEDQDTAE